MPAIVIPPGQGHRIGNVEFLARTADTPRFTFGIIEIVAGRELEQHTHDGEDDAFYILEGEMTFVFGEDEVKAGPGTFVLAPPDVEHGKRYEDIADLLEAGIDVYTTVNVQHLESLNDQVAELTGVRVRETFPDHAIPGADHVIIGRSSGIERDYATLAAELKRALGKVSR